jgi:hypothetical protein
MNSEIEKRTIEMRLLRCRALAREFKSPETLRNIQDLEAELLQRLREFEASSE